MGMAAYPCRIVNASLREARAIEKDVMRIVKRLLVLTLLALPAGLAAQSFPAKPVKLVVPFPAGGGVDVLARVVGQKMGAAIGQPVLVENRAGATGIIGGEYVANAAPDGYTVLVATPGPMTIAGAAGRKLGFDPLKSYAPISMGVWLTPLLVAANDADFADVRALIAAARARPGGLTFASGGVGNSQHLAGEMFAQMAGVRMVHVPFQGTAPALQGVIGRQVDVFFSDPSALPLVAGGKLKVLAVSSPTRSARLPNVPTVAEAGLPGFEYRNWYGFVAPAHTPRDVVSLLNRELHKALADAEVQARLTAAGMETAPDTPEAFAAFLAQDLARWARVIKSGSMKLE